MLSSTLTTVRNASRAIQPHASYVFRQWRPEPGYHSRVFRRGVDNRSWRKLKERAEYVHMYWSLYGSEDGGHRLGPERESFDVVRMARCVGAGAVVHTVHKYHMAHGNTDWWTTRCGLRPLDEPVIWWAPTWAGVDCIGCLVTS